MSHQIIKQPNGLYAIYSSICDNFVFINATPDDIVECWLEEEKERIYIKIDKIIAKLEAGEKPYYQFTLTWDEACDSIKETHGKAELNQILNMLEERYV